MKKIACYLLLFLSFNAFSQEKETINQNEIKLNMFSLVAFKSLDVTYEKLINDEMGLGTSVYLYTGKKEEFDSFDAYRLWSITPFFRNYFSTKYGKGFFVEAFAMLHSRNQYDYDYYIDENNNYTTSTEYQKIMRFAGGIAAGGKWVTKKGIADKNQLRFNPNEVQPS